MMSGWLKDAVFYQIYPQSFFDSNGDGMGDLPGIARKLDYIQKLGCSAIWLNPCFDSPFYDAGYDIRDYYRIAPRYGTNQDMKDLLDAVHERKMHLILDLVPGHTSIEHPWFRESMKNKENPYSDRYIWTPWRKVKPKIDMQDTMHETFATNLRGFIIGFGGRPGCCAVNFYSTQPALNYGFAEPDDLTWQNRMDDPGSLATREAMKDIMRFWLDMGCDGFRVDMAGHLVKNDPTQRGNITLWQDFRAFLDEEYPDAVMISEWGDPECLLAGGFHMDFLLKSGKQHYRELFRGDAPYFSRKGTGSGYPFVEAYEESRKKTEGKGLICIPSSNHDMSRITECLDEKELRIAYVFLFTMPGVPFLYYGDEIGMRNLSDLEPVEGSEERIQSRTPMQWTPGINAGFSLGPPESLYAPVDTRKDAPSVSGQMADEHSLWHETQRLIALRKTHRALWADGEICFETESVKEGPMIYERRFGKESVLVILNPWEKSFSCTLNRIDGSRYKKEEPVYSAGRSISFINETLDIPGESAAVFAVQS